MQASYKILINPIPLARPRWSGPAHTMYDSQSHAKISYGLYVNQQHANQLQDYKFQGPLRLEATFFMPLPRLLKQKYLATQSHSCRPDLDNLLKFLLDSCNTLYNDDAQFSEIICKKKYATSENGYTEFTITEIPNEPATPIPPKKSNQKTQIP